MKPKDKAKELLIEYFILLGGKLHENEKVYLNSTIWNEAKQCALLSIKKILIVLEEELLELYDEARTCDINKKLQEYWLEVKKEIELL